jgi:peptide methionine sulfoxide reductase msrA/msrB
MGVLMFFDAKKSDPTQVNFTELEKYAKATFAGGCFWCLQPAFDAEPGVKATIVGYSGGTKENPTFDEVYYGKTGHRESMQLYFDPAEISYERLVSIFWKQIDPTDEGGQFADRGQSYKTAIFYHDDEQKRIAEKSKIALEEKRIYDKPIVTEILPYNNFYPAEEYHQQYYKKEPDHYNFYKYASGRGPFIEKIWKDKHD